VDYSARFFAEAGISPGAIFRKKIERRRYRMYRPDKAESRLREARRAGKDRTL